MSEAPAEAPSSDKSRAAERTVKVMADHAIQSYRRFLDAGIGQARAYWLVVDSHRECSDAVIAAVVRALHEIESESGRE